MSHDDLLNRHPEVDLQPLVAGDFEAFVVEAELARDRGVDVGHVVVVLDGIVSVRSLSRILQRESVVTPFEFLAKTSAKVALSLRDRKREFDRLSR